MKITEIHNSLLVMKHNMFNGPISADINNHRFPTTDKFISGLLTFTSAVLEGPS